MRIWSLHPRYLDAQGLVALWREALLAQAVLVGKTSGYRNHPQLLRFRCCEDPVKAIGKYLDGVYREARSRGYRFDFHRIIEPGEPGDGGEGRIEVTRGQLLYEWKHLAAKLMARSPAVYRIWENVKTPDSHTIFSVVEGDIEAWEKLKKEI